MKIHVVARSEESAERFQSVNSLTDNNVTFHLGVNSLFSVINSVISSRESYALIVHDDVFLPSTFLARVVDLLTGLDAEWPNWGIVGNAGVSVSQVGLQPSRIVRYLFDPHGGPNHFRDILAAQSIDGNIMLLNCKRLRRARVKLPEIEGFHFYDLALSIETLRAGLSVLIAPQLACFHASGGDGNSFLDAASRPEILDYLAHAVANRQVTTINGPIHIPFKRKSNGIDIQARSLENGARKRPLPEVAIIVRSQFRKEGLLKRTLQSIAAFICAAGDAVTFRPIVVTEVASEVPDYVSSYAEIKSFGPYPAGRDTRNFLIRDAMRSVSSDRIWIIDDDDWLFPNMAKTLASTLNCAPCDSVIFVGSQHFHETLSQGESILGDGYTIMDGAPFVAENWARSLMGLNHIPICGMILPRQALLEIPDEVFDSIVYYEDYTLQLFSIFSTRSSPVVIDSLVCGISVRPVSDASNTINVQDRTVWNKSNAELASIFCAQEFSSALLSYRVVLPKPPEIVTIERPVSPRDPIDLLAPKERKAIRILRMTRGLVHFSLSPHRWMEIKTFVAAGRSAGIKGIIASLCEFPRRPS